MDPEVTFSSTYLENPRKAARKSLSAAGLALQGAFFFAMLRGVVQIRGHCIECILGQYFGAHDIGRQGAGGRTIGTDGCRGVRSSAK